MSKIVAVFVATCLPAPLIFLSFNLIGVLCLNVYKKLNRNELKNTNPRKFWNNPYSILTKLFNLCGYIWHGTVLKIQLITQKYIL